MTEERVVVIGGCGFLGFLIVKAFVEDPTYTSIHVISRNLFRNRFQGVKYHSGSVTESQEIHSLLEEIQPTLVIHTASPVGTDDTASERDFRDVNVNGTKHLLDAAIAIQSIRAFIFTSTCLVIGGISQEFATEDAPLLLPSSRADHYATTKAMAERAVLDANVNRGLHTLSLRPVGVYGERDTQVIPGYLKMLRHNSHRSQIGKSECLIDFVSAHKCCAVPSLSRQSAAQQGPRGSTQSEW